MTLEWIPKEHPNREHYEQTALVFAAALLLMMTVRYLWYP